MVVFGFILELDNRNGSHQNRGNQYQYNHRQENPDSK
jgi:hypothetical protein